jgi:hypothetical protein
MENLSCPVRRTLTALVGVPPYYAFGFERFRRSTRLICSVGTQIAGCVRLQMRGGRVTWNMHAGTADSRD